MHQNSAVLPAPTSSRLIFLRVPKSGSSTLQNLFYREYRGMPTLDTRCGLLVPSAWNQFTQSVEGMAVQDRKKYEAIVGHMKFGAHYLFPGRSQYVTFLRDPVRRFVSYYAMLRRMGIVPRDHRFEPDRPDWNLPEHETIARELDNGQTRSLANAAWDLPFGACGEEHLQAALANIENHFALVGLTEQFSLSLMLLKRLCGWRWHYYLRKNVTPKSHVITLSPDVLEAIARLNTFDYQLYAHVKNRLAKTAAKFGLSLQLEHAGFAAGNALHCAVHRVCHPTKRMVREAMRKWLAAGKRVPSPIRESSHHENDTTLSPTLGDLSR